MPIGIGGGGGGDGIIVEDRVGSGTSASLGLLSLRRASQVNAEVCHLVLRFWLHLCDPMRRRRRRVRNVVAGMRSSRRDELSTVLFPPGSARREEGANGAGGISGGDGGGGGVSTYTEASSVWRREEVHSSSVLDLLSCNDQGYTDEGAMVGALMSWLGVGVVGGGSESFSCPVEMRSILCCTTMSLLDVVLVPSESVGDSDEEEVMDNRSGNEDYSDERRDRYGSDGSSHSHPSPKMSPKNGFGTATNSATSAATSTAVVGLFRSLSLAREDNSRKSSDGFLSSTSLSPSVGGVIKTRNNKTGHKRSSRCIIPLLY
jgi:hypothetical protein